MANQKTFSINFYRPFYGPNDDKGKDFKQYLAGVYQKDKELLNQKKSAGLKFLQADPDYIFGEIRLYRDDAPHIGAPLQAERQIPLKQGEHVLEKAFFLYSNKLNIFALQLTASIRSPGYFEKVINDSKPKELVHISSIVESSALARLNNMQSDIRKIECSIARPSTKKNAITPTDHWSKAALVLADDAPGRMVFSLTGNMQGTVKNPLDSGTVRHMIDGFKSGLFDSAKATSTTGETVDLLSSRLRETINPSMTGKYPLAGSIRNELIDAFNRQDHELRAYKP